ncbi:hypothetical protein E8E13_010010 [Curvularia kusanoi]|uniref:Uncharacterized protein n=1 Tax=Curvularia kusanoi TaxID=90978 RepID=A0A9P4WC74_CURKU|nr:hypothetical protein E8E13_010010 [Curvularia kusanoi]
MTSTRRATSAAIDDSSSVLPSGTVEHDDPIRLYLNKRFSTYRAKDISIDEDGEDSFALNDGFHAYKAVSRKAHRELDLTIEGSGSKASKVALTRHYDQPLTAAKNEPLVTLIAPRGLGNGSPINSLWQWTKDAKGLANTLSTSVSLRKSDSATPTIFSVKQSADYTVNCKVNEKTKGLNITVKFPGALPFPADLVATIEYSAAYVDQAGYLAKYAVRQFDQLNTSYHQLERRSEVRSARNLNLEVEITTPKEAEAVSRNRNTELQKLLDASRTAAAAQDAELKKALAALAASKALARSYETHIGADKTADLQRDKVYQAHVNAHHRTIDQLQCKLSDVQEAGRQLQEDLDGKVQTIATHDASLASLGKQLSDAKIDINKLKEDLAAEYEQRFQN